MITTKEMFHEDLQPHYRRLKMYPGLISKLWVVSMMNKTIVKWSKKRVLEGIQCEEYYVPSRTDNYQIRVRVYRPENQKKDLPVMLYIHGGGYITGSPEMSDREMKKFIEKRPCVVISPDYRLALEKPYPAAHNDCYDTMLWAKDNSKKLRIKADKFMVAGHSAGGGLTASVTLHARDTKDVNIAFQMPIYPMIDDKQPWDKDRHIITPVWDNRSNEFGWSSYLADLRKNNEEISAYAAPSRNKDYNDFPPTITFVGNLEPFYKETENYVEALKKAGIPVEYKLYEGCFHGFDIIIDSDISRDALEFTYEKYAEYYDRYVISEN